MTRRSGIDHYEYWSESPPEPSPRLLKWVEKMEAGWRPNGRIRAMGRDACSEFYDVYQWEYLHVLLGLFDPELVGRHRQYRWTGERWEEDFRSADAKTLGEHTQREGTEDATSGTVPPGPAPG